MPVEEIVCAKCDKRYRMKPEYAGRTLKCGCGAKIVAPTIEEPEEDIYDVVEPPAPAYTAPAAPIAVAPVGPSVGMPTGQPLQYATPRRLGYDVNYAGFWWRFLAALIDGIIIGIPFRILDTMLENATMSEETIVILALGLLVVQLVTYWLYDALMTSSTARGTLGKKWLGIQVSDLNGDQLTFGRATGRYFAKIVSYLTIYIGFIWAAFHPQKRALHDLIAGTVVTKN